MALSLPAAAAMATTTSGSPPPSADRTWVGTWASSPQALSQTSFDDQTLRLIVHTSLGGGALRIRLANTFGTGPLTLGPVDVAVDPQGGPAVDQATVQQVTFFGSPTVTVAQGAVALSDAVGLPVRADEDLAVSIYVPSPSGPATGHADARQVSYVAPGDHASDPGGSAYTAMTGSWYWLNGVDVTAAPYVRGSLVAFGDSITDGYASTIGANRRWPDDLARRLQTGPPGRQLGVLDEGIDGNEVLLFRSCCGTSEPALARLDRDVLAQTGVRGVLEMLGTNDIGADNAAAGPLIAGLRQMVDQVHAAGLPIIGGTIPPDEGCIFGCYSPEKEQVREAVNAWIRDSGVFDSVVDFDKALRDPADPHRLLPTYDSGDHLHPNDLGYQVMADTIDLKALP